MQNFFLDYYSLHQIIFTNPGNQARSNIRKDVITYSKIGKNNKDIGFIKTENVKIKIIFKISSLLLK